MVYMIIIFGLPIGFFGLAYLLAVHYNKKNKI